MINKTLILIYSFFHIYIFNYQSFLFSQIIYNTQKKLIDRLGNMHFKKQKLTFTIRQRIRTRNNLRSNIQKHLKRLRNKLQHRKIHKAVARRETNQL